MDTDPIYLCECGDIGKFWAELNNIVCPHCGKQWSPISTESDPNGIAPHAPGAKLDAGKTMAWLCVQGFSNALKAVAEVTTKGATKYTPNGWTQVPDGATRYMDAFGRHMLAYGSGEAIDPDTGCLHKAQMIWNLLASLELELRVQKEGGRS